MPRIFGMDLSFHPTNEIERDYNPNPNSNIRHKPPHHSHRNYSNSTTTTRSPEPRIDPSHISNRNRNDRHRLGDRSHTTHSSSTTHSPAPRNRHYRHESPNLDSETDDDDAPGLALALRHPQRNQNQNQNPDPNHSRVLAIRDPLKAYDQASQDGRRPHMEVRRGSVRGLNPYGDGEFRGEIQSRDPVSYQGNDDSDLARGRTLRDASRRELGEGENRLMRRQDRNGYGESLRDRPGQRRHNSSKAISTESSSFTEVVSTVDSKTGQRKRSGKVAATFSRKGADGRLEMGGFRGGW